MASRKDKKGRVLHHGETQRKDGYYIYQYTDAHRKRRTLYAKSLLELREKEEALQSDLLAGIDPYLARSMTLNMAFDRYIRTKVALKESTYTNYVYMYDSIVRGTLGEQKVYRIKYSDVLAFYISLLEIGKYRINTIDNLQSVLHPTFTMLVRDGIIRQNPSDRIIAEIKKMAKWDTIEKHALTVDQQKAFMSYVADNPVFYVWLPVFTFFLGTGCRASEVAGVCWDDIDFTNRIVKIRRNLLYRKRPTGDCSYYISTPKTKSGERTIPLIDKVYDMLKEEYEKQKEEGFPSPVVDGRSGFVFKGRSNCLLGSHNLNKVIQRIVRTYNEEEQEKAEKESREPFYLPHFSCHILRHTFCTRYCEVESNIKVIQEVMGHADITTTMNIYAEATADAKKESMQQHQMNLLL